MSALQRALLGWVRVRATGARVERLINAAAAQGVALRNVRREGSKALVFEVSYQGFFALRPALRACGCRIRIQKRSGFPHLRTKLRSRSFLAVGALICLFIVGALTQFVWEVRLVGDADVERQLIAGEILAQIGVKPGMLRSELDARRIQDILERESPELVFVGARMRGLALEVEMIAAGEDPQMIELDRPADIVSDRFGTVDSIVVREGTAAVRPGQQVRPGDVLISGVAIGPGGEIPVHALGEVTLRVWVQGEGEAPLKREVTTMTGRYENRRFISICGAWMPIYSEPAFSQYRVAQRETPLFPGLYLPVKLIDQTLHESATEYLPRDEEEVRREAEQSAILAALRMIEGKTTIIDKRVEYSKMKDSTLRVGVQLQILRSAGVERAR